MLKKQHLHHLILLIPFVFLLLVSGCAEEEEEIEPTFTSLWDNVFSGCGISCHSANATDGSENGPHLDSKSNFYNNLTGKSAADYTNWVKTVGNCDNVSFITAGNANQSTLAASLILSVSDNLKASDSCDSSYSFHAPTSDIITDADIQTALIQWINDGAANN